MNKKEFDAMKQLFEKKNKLLDTTEVVHSEVYDQAVREVLTDKDGKVDYNMLKDIGIQDKFSNKLKDLYAQAARKGLGIKENKKGEFEEELLIKAYIGVTSETIRGHVSKKRHNYTKAAHSGLVTELKENQDQELTPIVYSKLKTKDIPSVIKNIPGADKYIDHTKIRREEVMGILQQHYLTGLTEKHVEGQPYHKKAV